MNVFSDSDEFDEPQTVSPKKREASVALECQMEMNIEGPSDKAARICQEKFHTAKVRFSRRHQEHFYKSDR